MPDIMVGAMEGVAGFVGDRYKKALTFITSMIRSTAVWLNSRLEAVNRRIYNLENQV